MTAEHVHGTMSCRPDMVPDFDRDDPQYHHLAKCQGEDGCNTVHVVTLDDAVLAYTAGHFEGREGWALYAGDTIESIHECECGSKDICVEPRFGVVTVEHVGAPS